MTTQFSTTSPRRPFWNAGLLYLSIIVFGLFSELGVRSSLITPNDPSETARNILDNEWLFRLGFASDALMMLADAVLAGLLYTVFAPVSSTLALIAAGARLAQAAILGMNLLNYYMAALLLSGATAGAFGADQNHALVSLFFSAHAHGYDIALLFFGVQCLVLGRLIVKSRFVPRVLGNLMSITGIVYLTGSFMRFLWPDLLHFVTPLYAVAFASELGFALWLLKGPSVADS